MMESNQPTSVGDKPSGSSSCNPHPTTTTTTWSPPTMVPYLFSRSDTGRFTPASIFATSLSSSSTTTMTTDSLQPIMTSSYSHHTHPGGLYSAPPTSLDAQPIVPVISMSIPCSLPSQLSDSLCHPLGSLARDYVLMEKELIEACQRGNDNAVLSLINSGVNVNCIVNCMVYFSISVGEFSPLMMASSMGHLSTVKMLIGHGAQVNLMTKDGKTALVHATGNMDIDIVKLLVDHGAKVGRESALVLASRVGDDSFASFLLDSGVEVNCLVDAFEGQYSPLMGAAIEGHSNIAELFLQRGARVDLENIHGKTALEYACIYKQMDIIKLLVDCGAKVGRAYALVEACMWGEDFFVFSLVDNGEEVDCLVDINNVQWSPLMGAASNGHINIAKFLLQHGAHVDLRNSDGKSALLWASDHGKMDVAKLLVDHGAKFGLADALYEACLRGEDISFVSSLIKNGAEVDCLVENPDFIFESLSPLMAAAIGGHANTVKLLLQQGAQVDLDNGGKTALHYASAYKQVGIAKLLVDHGAKFGLADALVEACRRGEDTFVSSLIKKGVEVDCLVEDPDDFGYLSPLMAAAIGGHTNTVKLLLQQGAQVDLDNAGETALQYASLYKEVGIAKLLVDHGAKVGREYALVAACRSGDASFACFLIDSGVNINILVVILGGVELSPLMAAAHEGQPSIANLLLDRGAQVDLQSSDGSTALIVASSSSSIKTAWLLLKHGAKVDLVNNVGETAMYKAHIYSMVDLLISAMIPKLIAMLQPIAHKWRELGKHLGLSVTTLNLCNNEGKPLQAVMNMWSQQNDPRPSWITLIRAVKAMSKDLARAMDQLVCPQLRTWHIDDDKQEDSEETESTDEEEEEIDVKSSEGTNEAQHLAAVEKAIKEKGKLKHTISHGAFVGPAGSGKSSLMSRLFGEMPSFTSPSTGVAERVVQVEVKRSSSVAVSADSAMWLKILYDDEAIRIMNFASSVSPPQLPTVSDRPHLLPVTPTATIMKHDLPQPQVTVTPSTSSLHNAYFQVSTPPGYIPPKGVFKRALQGRHQLRSLCQHFKNSWTLYLTDTGGQMEFQEVLPLLVSGPSIFFLTFRLNQDLHQHFTIEYRLPNGGRSDPYQSTLTVVEAILQTLASVASMGAFTYSGPQTKSTPLKPKVLIVGTHKDQLDPATAESKIKEIDQYLQKVIKSTAHYDEDLVVFSSESQLIFTVNNFSQGDSDFMKIKSSVNQAVHRGEFEVSYPAHWLIFSLILRQETIKDPIISYDQCFAVAQDCGIASREELNHALWFLHTKIGLVRHFPFPGLDDIVIRDPQVLFDHVTQLIVDSFTFKNVGKRLSSEFKQKGIFSFKDLEKVSQLESFLTPGKLLELLKHLRIVAPLQTEDGPQKYFMPCILAHSKVCDSQQLPTQNSDTPPLVITFKCGYCPKGLAGALIVYLLSNEMGSKFKWELQTDQIFRDQVSFLVSPYDIITLKIHPTYLELIHCREDETCTRPIQSVCSSVRQSVEMGIRKVSSDMNLTSNSNHSLSFYCGNKQCIINNGSHPATQIKRDEDCPSNVVAENGQCKLWCKRSGHTLLSSPPPGCSLWFRPEKESVADCSHGDSSSASRPNRKRGPTSTVTVSKESEELSPSHSKKQKIKSVPSFRDSFAALLPVAHDWKNIGVLLAMPSYTLARIECDNFGAINCLREMLSEWLNQTNPPPSWETLVEALESLGNQTKAKEVREKFITS